MTNRKFLRVLSPDLIAWAHMMRVLANKRPRGYTYEELVKVSGLNRCTVERYVAALHQVGAAYIESYDIDGRGAYSIRRWKLGREDDATPIVRTRRQRAQEQRHREMLKAKLRSDADEGTQRAEDARNVSTGSEEAGEENRDARFQQRQKVVFQGSEKVSHGSYSS